jgi:hypothetical protein
LFTVKVRIVSIQRFTMTQRLVESNAATKTEVNWPDVIIAHNQLKTVLEGVTAGYAHLYAYGEVRIPLRPH